jgi:hypothetical protein
MSDTLHSFLDETLDQWRALASALEKTFHNRAAKIIREFIEDIEAALEKDLDRVGTVAQIARLTGYTASHLHSQVRKGLLKDLAPTGEVTMIRLRDVLHMRGYDLGPETTGTFKVMPSDPSPRTDYEQKPHPRIKVKYS